MNREIKFRAYRKSTNQWVYGVFANRDKTLPQDTFHMSKFWELIEENVLTDVGQFTGSLDIKLNEIYENHIVTYSYRDLDASSNDPQMATIEYNKDLGKFQGTRPYKAMNLDMSWVSKYCKIIGTRFYNPELLSNVV